MNERIGSTLTHLRVPFSYFLLPIYLAALASAPFESGRAAAVFVIFHLLVYPASNAFNSYFDRDEGPIGGIERPPPVYGSLLWAALALDAAALFWAFALGPLPIWAVLGYGTGSKLYSWDRVRIKSRPWLGWLWTGLGQGTLTFISMAAASSGLGLDRLGRGTYAGSAIIGVFLLGVYPLTQVYQHAEDARRGDMTISRRLGVRGTFLLSGACLGAAVAGFFFWVAAAGGPVWAALYLATQAPALAYFLWWARAVFRDEGNADFRRAMRMNTLASTFMNLFFVGFLLLH